MSNTATTPARAQPPPANPATAVPHALGMRTAIWDKAVNGVIAIRTANVMRISAPATARPRKYVTLSWAVVALRLRSATWMNNVRTNGNVLRAAASHKTQVLKQNQKATTLAETTVMASLGIPVVEPLTVAMVFVLAMPLSAKANAPAPAQTTRTAIQRTLAASPSIAAVSASPKHYKMFSAPPALHNVKGEPMASSVIFVPVRQIAAMGFVLAAQIPLMVPVLFNVHLMRNVIRQAATPIFV